MAEQTSEEVLGAAAEMVAATRELMLAAATTDVPVAEIERARRLVDEATGLLAAATRLVGLRRHFDQDAIARTRAGEPWQVFTHNPLGIPLCIGVTGETATAVLEPTALLEGPPGILHGGFSAAMLDALLSTLIQAQGIRAVTVRLDVEFLVTSPLDRSLTLTGRLVEVEGRKVRTEGRISREGETLVRATALSITVAGDPD